MTDVPPFATELEEDARQEVEAKPPRAPVLRPRLDPVISKEPPRRPRPPEPPAAEAADAAVPEPPAELHVPKAIENMLEW